MKKLFLILLPILFIFCSCDDEVQVYKVKDDGKLEYMYNFNAELTEKQVIEIAEKAAASETDPRRPTLFYISCVKITEGDKQFVYFLDGNRGILFGKKYAEFRQRNLFGE